MNANVTTSAGGPTPRTQRIEISRRIPRAAPASAARRRSRLGAGVIDIEPATPVDPESVVLDNPSVPEDHRYCQNWDCLEPIGRSEGGRPGPDHGTCQVCGTPFDLRPKLAPGDIVADQYEVKGAFAHGGFGWLYIARDRNVDDRPCVLKGLLNTTGSEDAATIELERAFLAETYHRAIVDIYNFVEHEGMGYLVMEFVGGTSLTTRATRQRRESGRPMPVEEAAAFLLEVLPALGYLHGLQRVYCDFKPDNVIHVHDAVKLIDLGGVCRLDAPPRDVSGTYGYMAPEVPHTGPSIASDLYTVGRSLAVLTLEWPEWYDADSERLPRREDHEVLVQHDCLWRFLERACAPEPEERFASADEMQDALYGVMCQTAAARDGQPRPYTSNRWGPPMSRLDGPDWRVLPTPRLPNHPRLANRVAGLNDDSPSAAVAVARPGQELSWADHAAIALAHCELGNYQAAEASVQLLDSSNSDAAGHEPNIQAARSYLLGVVSLARGDTDHAVHCFDVAYGLAPGEAACALSYATALEAAGDATRLTEAERLYRELAITDPSWVAAVAGLARTLEAQDRAADAARELTRVPSTHPMRIEALTLACQAMDRARFDPDVAAAAGDHLNNSQSVDGPRRRAQLAVALYSAALGALHRGEDIGDKVGTHPARVDDLALATEKALRDLAATTPDPTERYELLDRAARTRPWTAW